MENFDYRLITEVLNAVTIKDPYPLPLMDELGDRVVQCEWFTKLD
jgi:hypothetical protein